MNLGSLNLGLYLSIYCQKPSLILVINYRVHLFYPDNASVEYFFSEAHFCRLLYTFYPHLLQLNYPKVNYII